MSEAFTSPDTVCNVVVMLLSSAARRSPDTVPRLRSVPVRPRDFSGPVTVLASTAPFQALGIRRKICIHRSALSCLMLMP